MSKKFLNRFFVCAGLLLGSFALAHAVIVGALPYTLTNGSTADASQVMADYNKIITDVNANAAHNGVNADITALTALSTPLTVAQGGSAWYTGGTSTGSANAQTVGSVVPTGMTLAAGQGVCFNAGFTNTGATTLVANGLTAKNVYRQSPSGNQALTGGEIVASSYTCAQYDGTQYVLRTPGYGSTGGLGPLTDLASATTTDLGTIPSHNVNITGTTTITGFGSTASTTYPLYQLTFAGAVPITYNATSMIVPGAQSFTTAANGTATALYLGSGNWQIVSYTTALQPPTQAVTVGAAVKFTATNNAGTPNTKIDMSATEAVMVNSNGYGIRATSVSCTIDAGTTGANGLDAGSLANATWYYEYVINNTTTTACLASTSATAPTMPSGYTYKVRVGAFLTDGSAHFYRIKLNGPEGHFICCTNPTTPFDITPATGAWTSLTMTNVPPTAVAANGMWRQQNSASSRMGIAPNANFTAPSTNPANQAPVNLNGNGQNIAGGYNIQLETANTMYGYTGVSSDIILLYGWTDAVNAS